MHAQILFSYYTYPKMFENPNRIKLCISVKSEAKGGNSFLRNQIHKSWRMLLHPQTSNVVSLTLYITTREGASNGQGDSDTGQGHMSNVINTKHLATPSTDFILCTNLQHHKVLLMTQVPVTLTT